MIIRKKETNVVTTPIISEFLAYSQDWTGGVFVAAADITGNGKAEIVTGADAGSVFVVEKPEGRDAEDLTKGRLRFKVAQNDSVALDCDGDAVLVKVDQAGGACHTGDRTCFDAGPLELTGP